MIPEPLCRLCRGEEFLEEEIDVDDETGRVSIRRRLCPRCLGEGGA